MHNHQSPLKNGKVRLAEAKTIASLLPAIMRQLFAADDHLAVELPLAQLRVCGMLYDGPHPMSALGREIGVSQSAMTQIADRLRARRMVKARRRRRRSSRPLPAIDAARQEESCSLREINRVRRVSAVLQQMPQKSQSRSAGHAQEAHARLP